MMDDSSNNDAPIRSKYRGLSWDKKYQGWRVRIYYYGKQRHVGRFEDEILAAKAYDKAAWYLYGANAITNFGFEECQKDPTGVSSFIIQAKEKADQEQSCKAGQVQQQLQYSHLSPEGRACIQAVLQNGTVHSTQQQQLSQQSLQQQLHNQLDGAGTLAAWQQPQLCSMAASPAAGVGADYAASPALLGNSIRDIQEQYANNLPQQLQQQQQQQHLLFGNQGSLQQRAAAASLGGSSQLFAGSPQMHMDNSSNASFAAGSMSSSNSTMSNASSTGAYMLCPTASGQTVVLPLPPAAIAAAVAAAGYAPAGAANLMLPLQQQQQQLLFMNSSTQPLLLSIDAHNTGIAGHMAAAAAAAADGSTCSSPTQQQQQQLLQQQLQNLCVLDQPLGSYTSSSSSMRNATSTPNSILCSPYTGMASQQQGMALQQQQLQQPVPAAAGNAAAAAGCPAFLEADTMQQLFPLQGYAGGSRASPLPYQQQQQLLSAMLQGGAGSNAGAFGESGSSSSSSCSPMVITTAPATASAAAGHYVPSQGFGVHALIASNPVVGSSNRCTVAATGSGASAHLASSPTHSSCSSGGSYRGSCKPFGLQGMMLC